VIFPALLVAVWASQIAVSQDLPGKIRGYRVHQTKVDVALLGPNDQASQLSPHILITIEKPKISKIGINGVRLAVSGQIESFRHEGQIEMVMFRDFTVNGVAVHIDDYLHGFRLRKSVPFRPSHPFFVNAGIFSLARAVGRDSEENWVIRGTALVFGKFKRVGFSFKRVIPVKIDSTIRNPLLN
jgi:hypothetical protein